MRGPPPFFSGARVWLSPCLPPCCRPGDPILLTALLPLLLWFGIGVFAARRHLDWVLSSLRTVRLARHQGNREAMLRSLGGILGEIAGLVALVAVLLSITRQISLLDGVPGIRGIPFWLVAGFLAALALYAVQYRRLERHADDAVASTPPLAAGFPHTRARVPVPIILSPPDIAPRDSWKRPAPSFHRLHGVHQSVRATNSCPIRRSGPPFPERPLWRRRSGYRVSPASRRGRG